MNPEKRKSDSPINQNRIDELARRIVERKSQKPTPPEVLELTDNLLFQLIMTLSPDDFADCGFRMQPKPDMKINDMTVLGDVIGGEFVFARPEFAEMKDYRFMNKVRNQIALIYQNAGI